MAPKRVTEKHANADMEKGGDDQDERTNSGKHVTKKTKVDSGAPLTPRRSNRISQVQGKAAPKKPKSKAAPKRKAKAKAAAKPSVSEDSSLSAGDSAPNVEAKNEGGELVKLSKVFLNSSGAILFFYPKANTPGCTKQACSYRDSYDELQSLGFTVLGVSGDGATAQDNWKQKHKLPYHLLCDTEHNIIKSFGCTKGSSTLRSHVVIAKGGKILDIQRGVTPADSADLALKTATDNPQK